MHLIVILLAAVGFGPPSVSASWGQLLGAKLLIFRQSDCKTTTVESGDSCGSLAGKCGISGDDFQEYNPDPTLCSTLQPGQRVCCSAGTLPDIRPKSLANGTCASYVVEPDDSCASIAVKNGLNATEIDNFNKVTTWGFNSCGRGLPLGLRICLSTGNAPMPEAMNGSVCGPTVPGSLPPINGSKDGLAGLNPCPLNACCNVWGQCGTTDDFCIPTMGDFGNPGSGPPGSNGCVHNCGTDVVNNQNGPQHPIAVGYYESWNMDRPCMHMTAKSLSGRGYTHIHWAFADLDEDFSVGINDTYNQFADFIALGSGTKRIISFGGWGVSTSPTTYDLLRQATSPDNREAFTDAVVALVEDHGLDGVDIDWEYPGAPDIPGIPPGQESDGLNYLATLQVLRDKLPEAKSLSIAAPASYWYLKAFPIANMAQIVDYIVYMTYDLHGQWDFNNQWADDGCPAGNCLRSHVNLTETELALAMITKANAPSYKIAVGISSYGRSFKMTDPNCRGPMCGFVGPESAAKPGMCTGTAGYISNAEINRIIRNGGDIESWFDKITMTDYLIYEGTEWVAYMSERTKAARMARWTELNFAGTVDWAVDLQEFDQDSGCPPGTCDEPGVLYVAPDIFTQPNPVVSCVPPCKIIWAPYPVPQTTTVTFPLYTTSLEVAWIETVTFKDESGSTVTTESLQRTIQTTTLTIPPVVTTEISFWNQQVGNESNATILWLTPSILPSPFTITNDPNPKSKSSISHPPVTRTITPPPWPYSFPIPAPEPTLTTTPVPGEIPRSVTLQTTGPPGPACTTNCGHKCSSFCGGPCLFCPPNGEWPSPDFVDPGDPNPPPFPPPLDDPPPGSEGDICQPDVKIDVGLCPNGNLPIFDPVSMQVRCDISPDVAQSYMTGCQAALDEDLESAKAEAELSSECCPADVRSKLGLPKNVKWPNVCANARSAISSRGKPETLTYAGNSRLHLTKPWYEGKWQSGSNPGKNKNPDLNTVEKFNGWGLIDCQVEEYPWGSGNPNRNPKNAIWDDQSVLRLIPGDENRDHGKALSNFYREAGGGGGSGHKNAIGLRYKVEFVNGAIGTSDDDYFLGADRSKNICADPYGNAFLLVNSATVNPGQRSYDPWWDDKLFEKTIGYETDINGQVTSTQTTMTNSAYCQYPSPGKKIWNGHEWAQHGLSGSFNRLRKDDKINWYSCDDYPGYSGPAMVPGMKQRRGRKVFNELSAGNSSTPKVVSAKAGATTTRIHKDVDILDPEPRRRHTNYPNETDQPDESPGVHVRNTHSNMTQYALSVRQLSSRSFLDPSAFMYLGCDGSDEDLCFYLGDACSSAPGSAGGGDSDNWDTPDPPPLPPPPSSPSPSPTPSDPPAPPPTPEAMCDRMDDNGLAMRLHVYNIRNWAEKDGGKVLHKQENGCGALTFWEWTDATSNEDASVWFDLPYFIKSGCVERAIKTAGGPDLQCEKID